MTLANGRLKTVALSLIGFLFGLLSIFFFYYTVRLIYVNLTSPAAAQHRQTGMYIGAIAFPVATIIFGWICWRCVKAIRSR